jgi:hypothetical protein
MEVTVETIFKKLSVGLIITVAKHLLQPPVVSPNEHKQQAKGLEVKRENDVPLFYTEPIFKSKKHDLL